MLLIVTLILPLFLNSLKSQGVVHLAQIDDIMKVLQDGFNDHHQQQQMELNRLQKQLQEQQEQQSALMKVNITDNHIFE